MTEIHRLFAGQSTPEKVLGAVQAEGENKEVSRQQRFYAHLYLALYFDVTGNNVRVASELKACQPLGTAGDFMADVARVLAARVQPEAWKAPLLLIKPESESSEKPSPGK
jgi:hypothetical protein